MQVWRVDASGRNAKPLVEVPIEMKGAAWSPDGRWIAFASRLEGEQARIFLLPADGSGPAQPIGGDEREQGNPRSPDGRFIAGLRIDRGPEEMMINLFDTTARTWRPLPNVTT